MDLIEQLSSALAARVGAATGFAVSVRGGRRPSSGILWRDDVVVTSEQLLGDEPTLTVVTGGEEIGATVAGRDPGTNIAVLKLAASRSASCPPPAQEAAAGSLALVVGADASGLATGRLTMIHAIGGAWDSMAGGRIDSLIRLDCRLGADEGGPILAANGDLLGMSTSGPRRRSIVIPTVTVARVADSLLTNGRVARGWLGAGLQSVMIPDGLRAAAGRESGLMVVSLASGAPAEAAGVLPGDIVLDLNGETVGRVRTLAGLLGADRIGQTLQLRVLRAGAIHVVAVTIVERPTR